MKNKTQILTITIRATLFFLLLFALVDDVAAQAVSFIARRNFTVQVGPIAKGDFNRDGVQDLVTAGGSMLLGKGDGTFETVTIFDGNGLEGIFIAVGDFNRDGIQDLAVARFSGVSILIGNGNGTFQAPVSIFLIANAFGASIAIGDFNRDGIQDLVFGSVGRRPFDSPGRAHIFLGIGNGTFQSARDFETGGAAFAAIGDFNRDGRQDLAMTGGRNIQRNSVILLGNGDGTFQPAQTLGLAGSSVAVGDFNADRAEDLAVTGLNDVSILSGNGDGTFRPARAFGTGESSNSLAINDLNGDGIQDLVVTNIGSDDVSVLVGNGDGSFQPAKNLVASNSPSSVAIGDFNGDGIQDLAVGNSTREEGPMGSTSIFVGNGDGSFRSEINSAAGPHPQSAAVGDFNGDGVQDLAVTNLGGSVSILLGNGDGNFQPPLSFGAHRFPGSIAVGNFNGDGFQDLAVANSGSAGPEAPIISLFFGNGDGTFQPAQDIGPLDRAHTVAGGDFNRDGLQDLVVVHEGSFESDIVSILLGNGKGAFQPTQDLTTGNGFTRSVAIGDFNRDGIQDLAVSNQFSRSVSVFRGNGNGTFQSARDFEIQRMPTSVAVGDFNGDGVQDLALSNREFFDIALVPIASILIGNGDGTFQPVQEFGPKNRAEAIVVGDFNGDGKQDLATANPLSDDLSVLLGNGEGTFLAAGEFSAGLSARFLAIGDFNKDGAPDIAAVSSDIDAAILLNDTESQKRKVVNRLVSFQPRSTTFRTTIDPAACPGFAGTFRFVAVLTNKSSSPPLFGLFVQVTSLTNGNLLQDSDGTLLGSGAILAVPLQNGFSDGVLSPAESVDVPCVICIKNTGSFKFLVNVLGTEVANIKH